jgi:hypothetical protein
VKRNPKPTPTSTRRQRRRSERTGLIGRSRGHTPIDAAAPHHPQAVLESRCYPLPHNGDAVADGRIRSTCPLSPTQSIATVSRARRAGLPLLSNLGSVDGVGAETPPPPARAAFADVLAAGAIPAGEHGALVAEQAPARGLSSVPGWTTTSSVVFGAGLPRPREVAEFSRDTTATPSRPAAAAGAPSRSKQPASLDVVLAQPQRRRAQQTAAAARLDEGSPQQSAHPTPRCCSRPEGVVLVAAA